MGRLTASIAAAAAAVPMVLPTATAAATPPPDGDFQKVTLNDRPGEPMDLAVLPDGRVLHSTRDGELRMHDPKTGLNTVAATFDVYAHDEEGLQSIALDPGFGHKNNWIYVYYSPPLDTPIDDPATPDVNEGDAPFTGTPADFAPFNGVTRLSRFRFTGGTIDFGSEQTIIEVPADRGICCHVGGDIAFDADGNLYLSTGDDTNPFESDKYTPIDERTDRNPAFDAQRTSANTNDLRGKILRIKVGAGGSYTIPEGNLFEPGTEKALPEIYVMGLRNPFRIDLDRKTGDLYVADYSPDADEADPARGPAGHGKWMVIRESANYGWPYCATARLPYVDYDFATGASGATFDCAAPVNEAPRNTGMTSLPPVAQPDIWYPSAVSPEFPELGSGGIGPMAGPAYRIGKPGPNDPAAWPKYYDGVPIFFEWTRDYAKALHLDDDGNLALIEPLLPTHIFDNPMAMEFGRDGALYVLEYGDGYFAENPDAQLARFDYIGRTGNRSPIPAVAADIDNGHVPLTVKFTSEGTTDPDGDRLRFNWDFDTDGKVDSHAKNPSFTYEKNGVYNATLKVTDTSRRSAAADVRIVVGNSEPVVTLHQPVEGEPFNFGDVVDFEVEVTDDQAVDCDRVEVHYILGHDDHGHDLTTARGCQGSIQTTAGDHDPDQDDLRGVFFATYTDPGVDDLPGLTGTDEVVLVPGG